MTLTAACVPITAIVFWGTDDAHSWLQDANSVGGSSDGTRVQCPLLFDKDYQPKPAFWAFVDDSKLAPIIQKAQAAQTDDYESAAATVFGNEETKAAFVSIWNEKGLGVRVLVEDAKADDTDRVTLYAQMPESDGDVITDTVDRQPERKPIKDMRWFFLWRRSPWRHFPK